MTKDEALKLALDALEMFGRGEGGGLPLTVLVHDLREALAQPEQWTPEDMAYRPGGLAQSD